MISQLGLTWKLQSTWSWMIQLLLVISCVAKHLVVSLACVDGDLHVVAHVELVFASVDSLVIDVNEDLLMKHYV